MSDIVSCYEIEWSNDEQLINQIKAYLNIDHLPTDLTSLIGKQSLIDCVSISDGFYHKTNLNIIVMAIKRWKKTTKIDLSNNFQEPILRQIQHIKFNDLKKINLKRNSIKSIEGLFKIHWPNLKVLDLSQNNIIEIKSMRKFNIHNKLTEFNIYANQIKDFYPICEMQARQLKGLKPQYYFNTILSDDHRWIAKMQSRYLQLIRLEAKIRIKNLTMNTVLKESQKLSMVIITTNDQN